MKKFQPAVSVLVAVYNVSTYLRQCLDSLKNQTLKDIEIICVNDGSTDSSLQILEEYAAKDDRIKLVNKINGGLPSARNAGLEIARGEYICFVDGDDFVDIRMYQKMYRVAKRKKADIVVCGGQVFPKKEQIPEWLKCTLSTRNITYRMSGSDALFNENGAKPFIWRDLIKRDFIEKSNFRFDEKIVLGEDQAFQFKIFPVAKKIVFIDDKFYNYRYERPESIMDEIYHDGYCSRVCKHIDMIKSIAGSWSKELSSKDTAVPFFEWAINFLYWDIIRLSCIEKKDCAAKFCNMLIDCGYYMWYKYYSIATRNRFDYLYELISIEAEVPIVSVVIIMDKCSDCIAASLESILAQTEKRFEILLYENNTDSATKNIVRRYLYKDPRICVRLGEPQPISEKYNDAIRTAKGKYICFFDSNDIFINNVKSEKKQEHDFYICDGEDSLTFFCNRPLYSVDKVKCLKLRFEDNAYLTHEVFFLNYWIREDKNFGVSSNLLLNKDGENIFYDINLIREFVPFLTGVISILQIAKENDLIELGYKVTRFLETDCFCKCVKSIIDSMVCRDSGDKSDYKAFLKNVVTQLIIANKNAIFSGSDNAVLKCMKFLQI